MAGGRDVSQCFFHHVMNMGCVSARLDGRKEGRLACERAAHTHPQSRFHRDSGESQICQPGAVQRFD